MLRAIADDPKLAYVREVSGMTSRTQFLARIRSVQVLGQWNADVSVTLTRGCPCNWTCLGAKTYRMSKQKGVANSHVQKASSGPAFSAHSSAHFSSQQRALCALCFNQQAAHHQLCPGMHLMHFSDAQSTCKV
jgi:hypothetical protein